VTVIIPAYNAAAHLATALDSLVQQTAPPSQVIVIDDGSTDGTHLIAERHGVICLRQEQRGPAAARNAGLQRADGEFVAFLDADDWYAPGKIEKSVAMLRELQATCLATDAWTVMDDRVERRKNQKRVVPSSLTKEALIGDNPVVCSTVVCRRSAVLDAGCFDEAPELIATEDYDLWLRLSHREPIAYLDDPLTFYRAHDDSLSSNTRFLRGVDRILAKVTAAHAGEAHFARLIARRRAAVRLDVAWDLLREGRRDEARELLSEAKQLAPSWKSYKLWLRTMLPRAWSAT